MSESDEKVSNSALDFVKVNKKLLIGEFCDIDKFPSHIKPYTIFMAGSPGAGKTEYSKALIKDLFENDRTLTARIDPDEIRNFIPDSRDHDIEIYKSAVNKGHEILFDYVQKHNQNVLIDGTLANIDHARKLIRRALERKRKVGVVYIYQDPILAWDFTKKREVVENRFVPKDVFVQSFFASKASVNSLKNEFGANIELTVVLKNYTNSVEKMNFNVASVDPYLKINYTMGSLLKKIK